MAGDRPSFEAELRKLAAQSRRDLGPHPTPEQLTAYHAGELPEDEAERVRDHLALCHDCADLLLDLEGFTNLEPPEGERVPSDADMDAAWQDLRARLQKNGRPVEAAKPEPAAVVVPLRRKSTVFSSLRFAYGLAATFLIAAVGLGVWNASLARESRQPRLIPLGEYLEPKDEGTRSWQDDVDELVFSNEERVVAGLSLDDASEFPLYQVEIVERGEEGKVLWRSPETPTLRNLGLDLPRGFLKPGRYDVRLFGLAGDRREKIDELVLRIANSP